MSSSVTPITSLRCGPLKGDVAPPGDKSISHRSIILGGIAEGETTVRGLLEGEDVLRTVAALTAMGAEIHKDNEGVWHIKGVGGTGLKEPKDVLYVGNSGTSARLLMGLVAGTGIKTQFDGDASLRKRPMGRVIEPLSQMGASFETNGGKMPLTVFGAANPKAISYTLPVASAQVKSAILLAGLNADGVTTVIERTPTRDHSENMLRGFGAEIRVSKTAEGDAICLTGKPQLVAQKITVPADPSSAAFPLVAALLCPRSEIVLRHVGINPRRAGLFDVLKRMGADIEMQNSRLESGEPVADLIVRASKLRGIVVEPGIAPSMIDEYPVLAVAAAFATGTTRMCGLGELRVKESDRLALMQRGLVQCGVETEIEGDDLIVHGTGATPKGGACIETAMDHRIAMSFLVFGMQSIEPVTIDDGSFIATSFPDFVPMMNGLGTMME